MTETEDNHLMRGVVQLPSTSTPVTDADEEVFLLYTNLAARKAEDGSSAFRGLGHVDSHEDILTISLKYGSPSTADNTTAAGQSSRGASKRKAREQREKEDQSLDIEIVQDKTALRSRKGDTGSVLWHASVDFAQYLLRQLHKKDPGSFLNGDRLERAHVLELGAGTGLLGIALAPFVRHYTATDIEELMPLIRKNIGRNLSVPPTSPPRSKGTRSSSQRPTLNVTAAPLDWLEMQGAPASIRHKLVPVDPIDLLLVVDCIYHPSLLPALVETIDYLTVPGYTAVIVVVELRAEDVVREFLQIWLGKPTEWEIWGVGGLLEGPYAIWVGWRKAPAGEEVPRCLAWRRHQISGIIAFAQAQIAE